MTGFGFDLPATNAAVRERIYGGEIFLLSAVASSLRMAGSMKGFLRESLGVTDLRAAHIGMSREKYLLAIGALRKRMLSDGHFQLLIRELMGELGFAVDQYAFDHLRLRAVVPFAHENPALSRSYSVHRDTWYSNPQCQINFWIPLHDVNETETFCFFPEFFNKPVNNDSEGFNYDTWTREVGFQNTNAPATAVYPSLPEKRLDQSNGVTFECNAGDILIFSANHLHQTTENTGTLARFSVDFRAAHLGDDAQNKGAPNVDNRSAGSALKDYVHHTATRQWTA